MATLFNVHCMLCGRPAGQLRDGTFRRFPSAPPLKVQAGRSRCGHCAGSLYLEAEDSPFNRELDAFPRVAASAGARPAARPASRRAS
jgi:hypothetical protein